MEQMNLLFDGETFSPTLDGERLSTQLVAVRDYMNSHNDWRTLKQISTNLNSAPEASVSARLRDLRKPKFGGFTVLRRRVTGGLYEYRIEEKENAESND